MKQTKKEIEATLRNKLAKQYSEKMENYQERIDRLAKELHDERSKRLEAQRQAEELKEKVEQYEDWNRRLQEFMDMSEEDRQNAIKETKFNVELSNIFETCRHFLGGML